MMALAWQDRKVESTHIGPVRVCRTTTWHLLLSKWEATAITHKSERINQADDWGLADRSSQIQGAFWDLSFLKSCFDDNSEHRHPGHWVPYPSLQCVPILVGSP